MRTHPAKKTTEIPNTQTPVKPVAAAPVVRILNNNTIQFLLRFIFPAIWGWPL